MHTHGFPVQWGMIDDIAGTFTDLSVLPPKEMVAGVAFKDVSLSQKELLTDRTGRWWYKNKTLVELNCSLPF